MDLSNALIIYFAAGAPFGVYKITTLQHAPDAKAFLNIALHICLWPIFTVVILREWLFAKTSSVNGTNVIESIVTEIELLSFTDSSASAIFDFREIVNRYAGLSEAAIADPPKELLGEFFEIGYSENETIASACIARRNREKIAFKHAMTRNEFVEVISNLTSENAEVFELAIRLAAYVKDEGAIADLKALSRIPTATTKAPSVPASRPAHV